jgi:hypothetical protein
MSSLCFQFNPSSSEKSIDAFSETDYVQVRFVNQRRKEERAGSGSPCGSLGFPAACHFRASLAVKATKAKSQHEGVVPFDYSAARIDTQHLDAVMSGRRLSLTSGRNDTMTKKDSLKGECVDLSPISHYRSFQSG